MQLYLNLWRASQDYRKHVSQLKERICLTDHEVKEKLSLESFAIWLQEEWPKYAEAKVK